VDNDIELQKKAIMKLQAFHSALGEDSQIFSPDEEVSSFGLFDKSFEEERDERLVYLMELRKFKSDNPKLFRKIKNLPHRSRVGRFDKTKANETICFIRNNRRDVFYQVHENGSFSELSFVETAIQFKTHAEEKSIPLHEKHHEQVGIAVEDFNKKIQTESAAQQLVDVTQSPHERRALAFLNAFTKFDFLSSEEVQIINAAKHAIKMGKFQKLQREINKLQSSLKSTPLTSVAMLEALVRIIGKYPLEFENIEDFAPPISIKHYQKVKPEIIISESFTTSETEQ